MTEEKKKKSVEELVDELSDIVDEYLAEIQGKLKSIEIAVWILAIPVIIGFVFSLLIVLGYIRFSLYR